MPEPGLPPMVQALLKPAAYPHPAGRIQLIQTHISYVFLTREYVYKVKKPVDFGFLDYSTLGKRRYYCHREVQLNSLLCQGTYLGVVPIRDDGGRFVVGGNRGTVVEYAVKMRRLPEERMLNRLIERDEATPAMLGRVADKLVRFHEACDTSPAGARHGDRAIRYNHRENIRQWTPYVGRVLTAEQDRILRAYAEAFFARKADLLQRRVEQSRIRHTHADLRSDAVCVEDGVCIFDCVEFSRRLSLSDVGRDVGFLQMDLEYRGRPDLAEVFVRRYQGAAGDSELRKVLPFYACFSACVRGKVEAFLLDRPEVPEKDKRAAQKRARRYFGLAVEYAKTLPPAMLVITCGLAGSGKSTVAKGLAPLLGAEVISSDVVRKQLAGLKPEARTAAEYRSGIYTSEFTERTYRALPDAARPLLMVGRSVILDAAFLRRAQRRAAARLARDVGAQFACLLVTAPEPTIRRRLARRAASGAGPSDADWRIYVRQKRRFRWPAEVAPERLITVDSSRSAAGQMRAAVQALRALSPLSIP